MNRIEWHRVTDPMTPPPIDYPIQPKHGKIMKHSEAKQLASHPVFCAFISGAKVQSRTALGWQDDPSPSMIDIISGDVRLKPESRLRAWEPEEVPVGACYRAKQITQYCATITGFTPNGVSSSVENAGPNDDGIIPFEYMLERMEHSVDGRVTWKPCGVEEAQ